MVSGKVIAVVAIIVAAAIGSLAVASYREPDVTGVRISGIKIDGSKLVFSIIVDIYNPNYAGGTVEGLEMDVYVNGDYSGHVSSSASVEVPRRGNASMPMEYTLENIPLIRREMTISVSGQAHVKIALFTFTPDVERSQTITLF